MKRRFVSKKKRVKSKFQLLLFSLLLLLLLVFLVWVFPSFKLVSSNQEFVSYLIKDSNHYFLPDEENIKYHLAKLLTKFDIKKPVTIIEEMFNYVSKEVTLTLPKENLKNTFKVSKKEKADPKKKIYIYNTHQKEEYSIENSLVHNLYPDVLMAAKTLKEDLEKYDYEVTVEEADITFYLNLNKMPYYDSYKASRHFLEEAVKKLGPFDLIIDLHRDALSKKNSTLTNGDTSYAKVLFVIGLEHQNYQLNLNLANSLNALINAKVPNLSRGVITKEGPNVNGIYNQDFGSNVTLIECGGNENTFLEVQNTLEVLAQIIDQYLKEAK